MELFTEALRFAAEKHDGQRRRMSDVPYVLHPIEVATIVGTMTDDQETLAAALLHDTVEDAGVSLEELEERFGRRVALLVMAETEDKRYNRPPEETWHVRKEETLLILQNTNDLAVKMLWLGDKLANMRSFHRAYLREGNAFWRLFNQKDQAEQAWYYKTIGELLSDLRDYAAYQEYMRLYNVVFSTVGEIPQHPLSG